MQATPTQAFTTHEEFEDYLDQISNCSMTKYYSYF